MYYLVESNNSYIDMYGNSWDKRRFSREDAGNASEEMIIFGCHNCKNCVFCKYCNSCLDCVNCSDCDNCSDCVNCVGCKNLVEATNEMH